MHLLSLSIARTRPHVLTNSVSGCGPRFRTGVLCAALLVAFAFSPVTASGQAPDDTSEIAPTEATDVAAIPDSQLAARLRAIFSNVDAFDEVSVAVSEGVVRLGGSVDRPEDRRAVEELVTDSTASSTW